jgi:hypothetical protein
MAMALNTYTMPTFYIKDKWVPDPLKAQIRNFKPKSELGKIVKSCLGYLPPEMAGDLLERITQSVIMESSLALKVLRHPDSIYRHGGPLVEDRGIVSRKKITTAGVTALCVAWGDAAFNAKYMALGTVATAESNALTALGTEITANHYTDSLRPTCTLAPSTNTVVLVGTHTHATLTDTIEEHGIFTNATPGQPTLWDEHLTGTVVLAVADGLVGTYTLTASAEA